MYYKSTYYIFQVYAIVYFLNSDLSSMIIAFFTINNAFKQTTIIITLFIFKYFF